VYLGKIISENGRKELVLIEEFEVSVAMALYLHDIGISCESKQRGLDMSK
jgi:CRISPR/Cas system-associated endonuclease Cas3-HD